MARFLPLASTGWLSRPDEEERMSTQEHPRAQAHTPSGDPPPDHEDDVWFPPPETAEPTKTESERAPRPASAPAETDGHQHAQPQRDRVRNGVDSVAKRPYLHD